MKRINRDTWIFLAGGAVVALAAYLVVFRPQSRKLDDLQTQIASQKTLMQSNAERAKILLDVVRRVEEMKAVYRELGRRIPEGKELSGFLQQISQLLKDDQLSSQLMQPGNPSREDLFHTYPIILHFEGSYLSVAAFLARIQKMQRLARVQKLKITPGIEDKLDVELQLNIYYTTKTNS